MIKPDIVIRLEKYASYKCDKGFAGEKEWAL